MTIILQRKHLLILFLAAQAGMAPAVTAEPDVRGQRLAASCANCHGTNGVPVGDAIPALAGQSKEALLTSLTEYKAGKRNATVMHQIAKGYSDQQLAALAAFFAAQTK